MQTSMIDTAAILAPRTDLEVCMGCAEEGVRRNRLANQVRKILNETREYDGVTGPTWLDASVTIVVEGGTPGLVHLLRGVLSGWARDFSGKEVALFVETHSQSGTKLTNVTPFTVPLASIKDVVA